MFIWIAVGGGLIASSVVSYIVGRCKGVGEAIELRRLNGELQYENRRQKGFLDGATSERDYQKQRYETVKEERDEYRRIAETHEIKMPNFSNVPKYKTVWDERKYTHLPDDIHGVILEDLKKHEGNDLIAEFEISPTAGYEKRWAKAHWDNNRRCAHPSVTLELHGAPEHITEQLMTTLRDTDFGFAKIDKENDERVWSNPDSPVNIVLNLRVAMTSGTEVPEPQIVEVLRVQKEFECVEIEKVIEKVVYKERVGAEETTTPSNLLESPELKAAVEIAVAEALAGVHKPTNSEVESVKRRHALAQEKTI